MLNPNLKNITLTKTEYKHYARHLVLPHIGIKGQKRLKKAKVLCVGIGGLGSSCLLYLVAAGVSDIGIIDDDIVEESNLQRQIIYQITNIQHKKVECAKKNLQNINPHCKIESYYGLLNKNNTMRIVPKYDIVIDGTDNFNSKSIISEACFIFNKPHIYGAISQFEGQVSVFNYQGGPLYRDLHSYSALEKIKIKCSSNGVLGVLTGIIGTLQAVEVIKIIAGIDNILTGRILVYNALDVSFKKIRLRKRKQVFVFPKNSIKSLLVQSDMRISNNSSVRSTDDSITNNLQVPSNILLVDVRKSYEYSFNHIKNSINIPLKKLVYKKTISFLKKQSGTKKIFIYCSTESRSTAAVLLLHEHGIASHKLSLNKKTSNSNSNFSH